MNKVKVYMRYREGYCKNNDIQCDGENADSCPTAIMMRNKSNDGCCHYCELEKVICKEVSSVEMIIPPYVNYANWEGTVKIGRKEYWLGDIDLLKVDYGEGYVQEWPRLD